MFSTIGSLSLRVRRRRSNDNLSSFVECDAEILTAESGTSLAQENVADIWITSKYSVFESALLACLLVYMFSIFILSPSIPPPTRAAYLAGAECPSAMSMRNSRLRRSCFARSFVRST